MSICKKTLLLSSLFFSSLVAQQFVALPRPEFGQKDLVAVAPVEKKEAVTIHPKKHDEPNGEVSVGLLIWKLRTSDSAYAIESDSNRFTTTPNNATVRQVNFDFDLGFRLGAGCYTHYDDWKLASNYTYYRPNRRENRGVSSPAQLDVPNGLSQAMSQAIQGDIWLDQLGMSNATTYYNFKYQTLDLLLQRSYQVGKVGFTPKFGLEAGWFNSDQRSQYTGGTVVDSNLLILNLQDRFWGLGPKSGLEMAWNLGRGFSLLQELNLSFLLGKLKLTYDETFTAVTTARTSLLQQDTRFVPHAALFMGLGYQYNFCSTIKTLFIKAGFEGHYLWNYIQNVQNGQIIDDGNLYTYGATVSAGLSF